MSSQGDITRRGLTMVELMLALTITVIVGAAITAMLGAVTTGVETRRDTRTHMLQANTAQVRMSAYIAPSFCVLGLNGPNLTFWHNDSRRSGTVHATEIRWLRFDDATGSLSAYRVQFPSTWTESQRLINDAEFPPNFDWEQLFQYYRSQRWLASVPLVDGLQSVSISLDHDNPQDSRHVTYRLVSDDAQIETLVSGTLRVHRKPQ